MKTVLFALAALTFNTVSFASDLPERFQGRWYFDEDTTVREWPNKATSDEERIRFEKLGPAMKAVRLKMKGNPNWFFEITSSQIISHDNILNPRFEILSVTEANDGIVIKARHFQVIGDDNPKEVTLKINSRNAALSLELWDEGALQLFYVLKKAMPNQLPDPTSPSVTDH